MRIKGTSGDVRDITPSELNMLLFLHELNVNGCGGDIRKLCGWSFYASNVWLILVSNELVAGRDGALWLTAKGLRWLVGRTSVPEAQTNHQP